MFNLKKRQSSVSVQKRIVNGKSKASRIILIILLYSFTIGISLVASNMYNQNIQPVIIHRKMQLPMKNKQKSIVITTNIYENSMPTETIPDNNIYPSEDLSPELQLYARKLSEANNINFEMFMAIMYNESRYTEDIISKDGKDFGICQINIMNHDWVKNALGITDIMDPKQNMEAAVFIINTIKEDYKPKNDHELLMMYNMGASKAKKYIESGVITNTYSEKILEYASSM